MAYALVTNNTIQGVGRLPSSARRLDTGEWVMGLDTAPPELVRATGWYEVVDTPRPADTPTTTHDRSVELVNGIPTVTWTERDKTQGELDAEAERARFVAREQAKDRLVVLTAAEKVRTEALDDDTVAAISTLFDPWIVGEAVQVGDVREWDGTAVECIQAHTTQADWTPDVVPALWKVHRTPNMTEWVAGISVSVGEEFTYQGTTYRVLQAHTTQVGWEPPNVPALWAAV